MMQPTQDIHIRGTSPLVAPREMKQRLPMDERANEVVVAGRAAVCQIIERADPRLLVVVGPCSIHEERAALEYAARLQRLAEEVQQTMLLLMRVYFEKPRTTVGWKGLIYDPYLNDSFDIAAGLYKARSILLEVAHLGLAAGTEMLDPITPQYIADLVAWASIGARTTESQTHRQMASGLSMPVGYKNSTDGNLQVAVEALLSARSPHSFLGIDRSGRTCVVHTNGNPWGHIILRGGRSRHNYDAPNLAAAAKTLEAAGLTPNLLVDCSHANSDKDFRKQAEVWRSVLEQRLAGNRNIVGLMLESNLHEGSQKLTGDPADLRYGVSITDGCIGWEETVDLLREAHHLMRR